MITLDEASMERWKEKNTKFKDYVNKQLKHFDGLTLIIGDVFSTRQFRKSVYEKFGQKNFRSFKKLMKMWICKLSRG